ncbi:hypothetical protein Q3R63_004396 [Salmonella enterica]|nr:hypothetical protein [Salmonella enterica]
MTNPIQGVSAQQCDPFLRSRSGATSGQRASAAPGGGNGCDHDAGAAAADGLNAGRTCAAVCPLPAVTLRGNVRATRQRCAGRRQRMRS